MIQYRNVFGPWSEFQNGVEETETLVGEGGNLTRQGDEVVVDEGNQIAVQDFEWDDNLESED